MAELANMVTPRNGVGGAWLISDMALNIWALSIVKAMGLGYPAVQLVFLRAVVGLAMMLPWAWRNRADFWKLTDPWLHGLRVILSALTLTTSFFAIARLPIALFTAISFTRPLILMIMAVVILSEQVPARRWIAAAVGLVGVGIAVSPSTLAFTWGLPALLLAVVLGSAAVIVTRRLSGAPTVVMMTLYAAGLTILTGPFALSGWQPVVPGEWPLLLAIGVFAQSAQFCFLQAHRNGEAGFLAVLGYLSLVFSTGVGFFVFGEVPTAEFFAGAVLIIGATLANSGSMPFRRI